MNMGYTELARAIELCRKMEKAGLRLEDRLQPPYEAILVHSASTIVTGNQAAAAIIGCDRDELTGMNAWTLFPHESVQTVMSQLAAHSTEPYRVMARRRNGELFWVELKGSEFEFKTEPLRAVMLREVAQADAA